MHCVRNVKISAVLAGKLIFAGVLVSGTAAADAFTAEKVMKSMTSDERSGYFAGVIEGLAIARYNKDGKKKDGMECIYDWYYKDKTSIRTLYEAFDRYPAYPPGSIIDVLAKRKCGE